MAQSVLRVTAYPTSQVVREPCAVPFALSALGTHMVEVPWSDVEAGGKYAALFGAATQLLKFLTEDS